MHMPYTGYLEAKQGLSSWSLRLSPTLSPETVFFLAYQDNFERWRFRQCVLSSIFLSLRFFWSLTFHTKPVLCMNLHIRNKCFPTVRCAWSTWLQVGIALLGLTEDIQLADNENKVRQMIRALTEIRHYQPFIVNHKWKNENVKVQSEKYGSKNIQGSWFKKGLLSAVCSPENGWIKGTSFLYCGSWLVPDQPGGVVQCEPEEYGLFPHHLGLSIRLSLPLLWMAAVTS